MKKIIAAMVASVLAVAFISIDASAQGRVTTKKYRLSDFATKTTKVALSSSNSIIDMALTDEIQKRWRVSPFEFCTFDEYKSLKDTPGYYFLVCSPTDEGVITLSLEKGGKEDDSDPMNRPFDIVELPVAPVGALGGRELTFLPSLVDIIQDFVEKSSSSDFDAYSGLRGYNKSVRETAGKTYVMAREDISDGVERIFEPYPAVKIMDADDADDRFLEENAGDIVSYGVYPTTFGKNSYAYMMLIDASSHQLMYYTRRKVSSASDCGFKLFDAKEITAKLKK